jgi:hypothetical protein
VRFRDEKPGDMDRAREAVREWRAQHPEGTPDQLVADIGGEFHHGEWAAVLRSILHVADRHAARAVSGITAGTTGASR